MKVCHTPAFHANNLFKKFKEKKFQNKILYYLPHSNKTFAEGFNAIQEAQQNSPTLKNHTFCLINDIDCKAFADKIINEIKAINTTYKGKIADGNSHCDLLSTFFQKQFQAFMRPGYNVDALLDKKSGNTADVADKLQKGQIQSHETILMESKYLVVPNVNTKAVADRIRRLYRTQ